MKITTKSFTLTILVTFAILNWILYFLATTNRDEKHSLINLITNWQPKYPQSFTEFTINDLDLANFSTIHKQNILKKDSRVVFCQPKHGYGNQIYSMLTSFLIAFLTDSALLFKWPYIHNYISTPLYLAFRQFDDMSSLDFKQKSPKICPIKSHTVNTWNYLKKPFIDVKIINTTSNNNNFCSRYFEQDSTAYFFDLAANPEHMVKLAANKFVRRETVERALRCVRKNEVNEAEKVNSLFMVGFEYAGNVLKHYWRLNENWQRKVDMYYENEFRDFYVIGMQMRSVYLDREVDVETFIRCAFWIEKRNREFIGGKEVRAWDLYA